MGDNFEILFDREKNIQKNAEVITKFKMAEAEYLIYSTNENELNKQIFVSKIITNTEGKSFIQDIPAEEKAKLSNIVYNMVIIIPSENLKGLDGKKLIDDFESKYNIKISKNNSPLGLQEYYSNCSIAITSNELVNNAKNFYQQNLLNNEIKENINIPTWSMPVVNTPINNTNEVVPQQTVDTIAVNEPVIPGSNSVNTEANVDTNINSIEIPQESNQQIIANEEPIENSMPTPVQQPEEQVQSNPQLEKIAIVSDPSLNTAVGFDSRSTQPNIANSKTLIRKKSGGFASNKYVIIGTACLVLAIAVVVVAIILIKNK